MSELYDRVLNKVLNYPGALRDSLLPIVTSLNKPYETNVRIGFIGYLDAGKTYTVNEILQLRNLDGSVFRLLPERHTTMLVGLQYGPEYIVEVGESSVELRFTDALEVHEFLNQVTEGTVFITGPFPGLKDSTTILYDLPTQFEASHKAIIQSIDVFILKPSRTVAVANATAVSLLYATLHIFDTHRLPIIVSYVPDMENADATTQEAVSPLGTVCSMFPELQRKYFFVDSLYETTVVGEERIQLPREMYCWFGIWAEKRFGQAKHQIIQDQLESLLAYEAVDMPIAAAILLLGKNREIFSIPNCHIALETAILKMRYEVREAAARVDACVPSNFRLEAIRQLNTTTDRRYKDTSKCDTVMTAAWKLAEAAKRERELEHRRIYNKVILDVHKGTIMNFMARASISRMCEIVRHTNGLMRLVMMMHPPFEVSLPSEIAVLCNMIITNDTEGQHELAAKMIDHVQRSHTAWIDNLIHKLSSLTDK